MIDVEAGIFTAMCLLIAMLCYLWFTRNDPGQREFPGLPPQGDHPYPVLSDFPMPEQEHNSDVFGWVNPSYTRLATTGELRQLAYAGDIDAINSEVAAWKALLQLDEWTNR